MSVTRNPGRIPYRKWFYTLVPNESKKSLMDHYEVNELNNKLIVCKQTERGRTFTLFEDYLDFGEYYYPLEQSEKNFYEIILGEYSQKPHFDIDLSIDEPRVLESLVDSLIKVFNTKFGIELCLQKDILVFTSHGESKGVQKFSYHVIVPEYCSVSNDESRLLYNEVLFHVPAEFQKYIDRAVYNSRQQFRILYSSKAGSDRVKVHWNPWIYQGQEIQYSGSLEGYDLLLSSLIGQCKLCRVLTVLDTTFGESKRNSRFANNSEFDGDMGVIATMLNEFDPNHKIRSQKNGLIALLKKGPYKCKVCHNTHTNENPFLTVYGGRVWFHCRRSNDKVLMGHLVAGEGVVGGSDSRGCSPVKIPAFEPDEYTATVNLETQVVEDKITSLSKGILGKALAPPKKNKKIKTPEMEKAQCKVIENTALRIWD